MPEVNPITLTIGLGATGFLFWVRKGLKPFLISRGVKPKPADIAQKAGPVGAVVVTTLAVWAAGAHRPGRGHRGRGAAGAAAAHDAGPVARPHLGSFSFPRS
jgi:hypothetical protein